MPLTALPATTGQVLPGSLDHGPVVLSAIFIAETGGTTALVATFYDTKDTSGTQFQVRVPAGTSKEVNLSPRCVPLRAGLYVSYSGGTPAGAVVWE